jgi:hypothetical protein
LRRPDKDGLSKTVRLNLTATALLFYQGLIHQGIAQTIQTIPYEESYRFGSITPGENREGSVALDLLPNTGESAGKIWIRETPDGILILGRTSIKPSRYARFPMEMNSREHVGVWLATARNVAMPEIGWGNQFGLTNCEEHNEAQSVSAEACQSWSARQVEYRKQLRRLFVRHWEITPTASFETHASSAYRTLLSYANDRERGEFTELEPHGAPLMQLSEGNFSFDVLIRWSDFPPANSLDLSHIYIAVEVCGSDGKCSSTAPGRVDGDPATFTRLNLPHPHVATITPCGYPLQQSGLFGKKYPGWYFMDDAGRATEIFSLQNNIVGYRYDPEGLSPSPIWTSYFSRPISRSEVVCGPFIRYAAGGKIYALPGYFDESHLSVRRVPDGHLLKSGPTLGTLSPLGSGQCGACPTADLAIFHIGKATGITLAFSGGLVIGNYLSDGDIRISSDWKTVTVYSERNSFDLGNDKEGWSSKRYCLTGIKYKECGSGPPGPPPEPRQVVLETDR